MFFLLCYAGVNLSCFLLDLLDAPSWRPRWKWHHFLLSGFGALLCFVIMLIISWVFTIISVILAALIYYYVSVRGKAGDWGDGFKSAYFQLALRSIRTMGAKQVHPKNWYPIPLIYCKPWGILPADVPCHPMLPDFANCMKKKGRGLSIFVSIMEGDYGDCIEEAREATRTLTAYIEYKKCEAVGDVIVARTMEDGFRTLIQSMGIGNLKPNMVCMRYPEIWRDERRQLGNIPNQFVNIIRDCHVGGKAVVIVKGIDDWPGEYQKQYGFIDLYWIIRDGGLMLLLAMLLKSKKSFEACKIRVFCTAQEEGDAEQLKADVKKFLYDLRMEAEVIVLNYRAMDEEQAAAAISEEHAAERQTSADAVRQARKRIAARAAAHKAEVQAGDSRRPMDGEYKNYDEEKTSQFLHTTMKLNSIILKYSRAAAAVVLVSLPPPPPKHPSYNYMEYMDLLVDQVPKLLMVRGYKRDVVTIYS
ncbi:cation-chloride co-transporter protein [Klebsormidium nitens]|uniref:Cation-chloride co-transporter protein n=1 Tax=Klebsormidium nitens TaxID=105231 RepID=A0A1Y1HQQ5_KLENI|nr:cation-chloride co-transporter protein [Klebsormidium nitens]|eukprot:GAQ80413.1 cation-chloride co-transporter protein [Klebsormidium nitens]